MSTYPIILISDEVSDSSEFIQLNKGGEDDDEVIITQVAQSRDSTLKDRRKHEVIQVVISGKIIATQFEKLCMRKDVPGMQPAALLLEGKSTYFKLLKMI